MDMSSSITLDNIRSTLIRQEDTIIFNLIERAQFASNPSVYASGGIPVPGVHRGARQGSSSSGAWQPVTPTVAERRRVTICVMGSSQPSQLLWMCNSPPHSTQQHVSSQAQDIAGRARP
jgi:hypothetical protein